MFTVGQNVVCIDSVPHPEAGGPQPIVGRVYTVSWVNYCEEYSTEIIDLIELPSPESREFYRGWNGQMFRPVIERKTDISLFTAMLTPSPVTVDALNMADFARELVQ